MVKQYRFNLKLDAEDKRRLARLARRLERTQADTIRRLIRQATGGPEYEEWPHGRPDGLPPYPLSIYGDYEEWGWSAGE